MGMHAIQSKQASMSSGCIVGKPPLTGLGKGCASCEGNPILRRSMRIQHYIHVKIPETILAGSRRSRSRLSAQAAHREVSEFVHAAFLRHGAER
jgi:hypothetical protein